MKIIIFGTLSFLTLIFYMLEISFRSFSKISLAGFLDDIEPKKGDQSHLIKNYEIVLNSFRSFSFFLQLLLFIFSFFLLEKLIGNIFYLTAILIFLFIFIFDFLIYSFSFFYKEFLLEKLMFLQLIPRIFFYPANFIFSLFLKKKQLLKEPDNDDLSEKELEVFFEEGRKEGVIEKEDKEMIESVLEFGDTLVKEIMTPRVDMIYVDKKVSIKDLVNKVKKFKKSRYPIISGKTDNIVGIILSKDIFNYWEKPDFNIDKIIRKPFFSREKAQIS
ncbi:Hemolysin [Candidatus Methanophagaceae archaeon]|nr:Hemolysin [Methanophagales archaeon]